jgi:preprotein translocase subunit SecG
MFKFLLVVHTLIAATMVGVILMQRSEGGGLAGGGSPTGLMSARGAADFLTRTTAILASLFILLSIGLAALATVNRRSPELDQSLDRKPISAPSSIPGIPMGGAAPSTAPAPAAVAPAQALPAAATDNPPVAAAPTATPKAQAREVTPEPRKLERPAAPKAEAPAKVTPPKVDTSAPTFKLEPKPAPAPTAPAGPPANSTGTTTSNP